MVKSLQQELKQFNLEKKLVLNYSFFQDKIFLFLGGVIVIFLILP